MQDVAVIGAGHMGTAMIAGIRKQMPDVRIEVAEQSAERVGLLRDQFGIEARDAYTPRPGTVVLLAIPPQAFEEFAARAAPGSYRDCLVISVMGGVTVAAITKLLDTQRVVRSIPNTPSEVGQGMTVFCADPSVGEADVEAARRVLSVIGEVLRVADETLLDDASALCGGGPAFVAHIAGAFADFAVTAGFDASQARAITCQVLRGTADLLEVTRRDPEEVARQVMTPGGTTERGMSVLRQRNLHAVITEALDSAAARSRELGAIGAIGT